MAVPLMKILLTKHNRPSDAGVYLLLFVKSLREKLDAKYQLEIKDHLEIIRNVIIIAFQL